MGKFKHEFRDPIHNFIYVDDDERKVIDSKFFQRLRYIHQLALAYLLYPGASHKRFEHSLGVMELSSKIFDVVFDQENYDKYSSIVECDLLRKTRMFDHYKKTLRFAALCHDIGHLPFSHAAEAEIFPKGSDHEDLTYKIITESMLDVWESLEDPIKPVEVANIAVGPVKSKNVLSEWEEVMSEIITGDAFGADRMDYLLRDSYHIGVAYGKYDRHRLIDCIRLCRYSPDKNSDEKYYLGLDVGGLHSAEALMLARYYMFSQVYMHRVRRIYDYHLKNFFSAWIKEMKFDKDNILSELMELTDNDILYSMNKSIKNNDERLKPLAERVINRDHFKNIYTITKKDIENNALFVDDIETYLWDQFGAESIYVCRTKKGPGNTFFPVIKSDGSIEHSNNISDILKNIPAIKLDMIYADRSIEKEVMEKINEYKNRDEERRHDE